MCLRILKSSGLVLLAIMSLQSFAQVGFIGKRNEIKFDVFEPVLQGKYELQWNFAKSENFGWMAGLHMNMSDGTGYSHVRLGGRDRNSSESLFGNYNATGIGITAGMRFTSAYTGMPLPLGYYWELAWEYNDTDTEASFKALIADDTYNGETRVEFFDENDNSQTNVRETTITNNTEWISNSLKIVYGFNMYVVSNITLDLAVVVGGGYKYKNTPDGSIGMKGDFTGPYHNPWSAFTNDGGSDELGTNGEGMFFYLMPKIKLGYIF